MVHLLDGVGSLRRDLAGPCSLPQARHRFARALLLHRASLKPPQLLRTDVEDTSAEPAMGCVGIQSHVPEQRDRDLRRGKR